MWGAARLHAMCHTVPHRQLGHCGPRQMLQRAPLPRHRRAQAIRSVREGAASSCGARRTGTTGGGPLKRLRAGPAEGAESQLRARVATEGDVVSIKYVCRDEDGRVVDESAADDPVTFEVGAGEAVGNPLYQAFDGVVRGMALGESTSISAQGGEWQRELLFDVPADHPEIHRLQGRYRNQGGLKAGMLVELANGATGLIAALQDDTVRIDANNMMAGKVRIFELTLLTVEPTA